MFKLKMINGLIEPVLSDNAKYITESRYGIKGEDGKLTETVKDIFWRVAYNIAKANLNFQKTTNNFQTNNNQQITNNQIEDQEINAKAVTFYEMMASQKFLPNTPCLVNAGKKMQQLSACFVLPIDDSMESILTTMKDMAMIHKSGGGTGFSFSRLRPSGDYIASSGGTTVGPVSFMQAYNDVTSQIKQGGVRRGANMGMLSIEHPDVLRFAVVKLDEYCLTNFNISLAVTNKFMDKIESDKKFVSNDLIPEEVVEKIRIAEGNRDVDVRLREIEVEVTKLYDWAKATNEGEGYELINPKNGQVTIKLNAYKVFNLITRLAWQFGDPGLVFIDRMNESSSNPVPKLGIIEATNPCGEQPLLPYDACNLGSINLSRFVIATRQLLGKQSRGEIATSMTPRNDVFSGFDLDWTDLARVVHEGVEFLDNVVEVNQFPVPQIREMVSKTRRIGLGVMGFADMLFKLGIRYDSPDGIIWAEKVMKFINDESKKATVELALTRGVFPAWEESVFAGTAYRPRNMALTTIAPTGTISMVADTSSGVEPMFSLGYQKNTVEGKILYIMNQVFVEELKKRNIYSEELLDKVVKNGGKLNGIEEIPQDLKNIFITALEISPEWHIKIQAAFQRYTDNAVSKTINFPKEATVEDVRTAYLLAYSLGTKGITIYRSGSRGKEVIQTVKNNQETITNNQTITNDQLRKLQTKKKTPKAARGVRLQKSCDAGKVYTSVFFEGGDGPVEIFVNLGKSGGYMAGSAEVTGRLASLALKYGANLEEVADELVGISCGQKIGFGNNMILSMFDAVGKALLEIAKGDQLDLFEGEKDRLELPKNNEIKTDILQIVRTKLADLESKFSSCPDCGSPLYAEEGCFKCSNSYCGYSKCS
ncbi:ribonucleoside-diphosphate reductase, adenosylcobalamin-dependent [Candidatus Shapirobacteria bacterium CG_4_9_14_3_um_filter_36_12]|uniref:Vitamin B12-dependent ribonucleotide reductase n=1 Tax=Candidatus Shapirobacteria bacterium CG_4_9_14_3_um_filter_36_12 TaxID=1974877 RepID=A0A2M7XN33_9BACT|nr:MAG: ribonucleoside-diphosphate reductase, adenosylcobalamin-dependent [Candidatus Shapirobacteria bacterium CG_4_9_14_3_um_filter_36_12]